MNWKEQIKNQVEQANEIFQSAKDELSSVIISNRTHLVENAIERYYHGLKYFNTLKNFDDAITYFETNSTKEEVKSKLVNLFINNDKHSWKNEFEREGLIRAVKDIQDIIEHYPEV